MIEESSGDQTLSRFQINQHTVTEHKEQVVSCFCSRWFLAHLIGDYLLQTDKIAYWKQREARGVLVHGLIVTLTAMAFAVPFNEHGSAEFVYALVIGLVHTGIDLTNFYILRKRSHNGKTALAAYLTDQMAHIGSILLIVGFADMLPATPDLLRDMKAVPWFIWLFGYVFLSFPAWVLLEFIGGTLRPNGPDFQDARRRRTITIFERSLGVTLFFLSGQILLVPLATVPRLLLNRNRLLNEREHVYRVELFAGLLLTVFCLSSHPANSVTSMGCSTVPEPRFSVKRGFLLSFTCATDALQSLCDAGVRDGAKVVQDETQSVSRPYPGRQFQVQKHDHGQIACAAVCETATR